MNKTGGPAFPIRQVHGEHETYKGMTLRDYFAAKAMVVLLTERDAKDEPTEASDVGELAYLYADAMLDARAQ
jgi:hypothetical protein